MISQSVDTLKTKSLEFTGTDEDLRILIESLEFEMNQADANAVGLSAIQIGIPEQVGIVRISHKIKFHGQVKDMKESYNLYNAKIISQSNSFIFKEEGCLSFPGLLYDTHRYNEITILNGDGKEYKFSGFIAVVVQHELDHWDGIVIADRQV